MEIPTDIQQELAQFQQLQEQFQLFSTQRAQMEMQLRETGSTLDKLTGLDDATSLYQNVGSVLIKVIDRKKLMDELGERKETLSRRIGSMKQQEERLKERLESMGNELNEKLKSSGLA